MLNALFQSALDAGAPTVSVSAFILSLVSAMGAGLLIAVFYTYKAHYTKGFVVTVALLPAIVCVVIMMVNGSIGAGVAVAGTFSLVRFRSVPGGAREICAIFFAMAAGLAVGMGFIAYALLFTAVVGLAQLLLIKAGFGERRGGALERTLHITIPEDLDYAGVFDEPFAQYAAAYRLTAVKTTNLGSLFKLTYDITLKDGAKEKELIDALRCRNGNLEIACALQAACASEL